MAGVAATVLVSLAVGPALVTLVVAAVAQTVVIAALAAERAAIGRRHRSELTAARRLARTDDLTGLGNRRLLTETLDQALAGGGPVALMLFDLDGFKTVNDTHGHVAGDHVLRVMATRLLQTTDPGWVVTRLGGDEFAVLAPGDGADTLPARADEVRAALGAPIHLGPHTDDAQITVTASTGTTTRTTTDQTPTDLLTRADTAMYHTKTTRLTRDHRPAEHPEAEHPTAHRREETPC